MFTTSLTVLAAELAMGIAAAGGAGSSAPAAGPGNTDAPAMRCAASADGTAPQNRCIAWCQHPNGSWYCCVRQIDPARPSAT